jgi:hypothetical protein
MFSDTWVLPPIKYTLALRSRSKDVEPSIPANYTGGLCDLGTELVRLSRYDKVILLLV